MAILNSLGDVAHESRVGEQSALTGLAHVRVYVNQLHGVREAAHRHRAYDEQEEQENGGAAIPLAARGAQVVAPGDNFGLPRSRLEV